MSPKNLFLIILKVLGIFFIKDAIEAIPPFLAGIQSFWNPAFGHGSFLIFFYSLIILIFYLIFAWILIFKSDTIINWLKLDKGFDQNMFSFQISAFYIIKIAVIVTGLFILVVEIPNFCQQVYTYFQFKQIAMSKASLETSAIIYTAVKLLLALIILGERNRVTYIIAGKETVKDELPPQTN